MDADSEGRIVEFLGNQKKHFGKPLISEREIADAVGLAIYQTKGCLEVLQSFSVVEKVNSGQGRVGKWRLL